MTSFIKSHWQLTLLFIVFLPVLLRLGFWQLDRAELKQQHITAYKQQLLADPISVPLLTAADIKNYRPVSAVGTFDSSRYWLLDNRSRAGQVGYEVVMPLLTKSGSIVLVNRGWLKSPITRDQLPEITTPAGTVSVSGHLYQPQKNAIIRHGQSDLSIDWPKRVIQLDIASLQTYFEQAMLPMLLRLDNESDAALVTDWSIINTRVEKHRGYAFQWFSMALALCLLTVWFVFKEPLNKPE